MVERNKKMRWKLGELQLTVALWCERVYISVTSNGEPYVYSKINPLCINTCLVASH